MAMTNMDTDKVWLKWIIAIVTTLTLTNVLMAQQNISIEEEILYKTFNDDTNALADNMFTGAVATTLPSDPNSICHSETSSENILQFLENALEKLRYIGFDKLPSEMEIRTISCGQIMIIEIEEDKIMPGTIRLGGEILLLVVEQTNGLELLHHALVNDK